jgi:hypothetical protein
MKFDKMKEDYIIIQFLRRKLEKPQENRGSSDSFTFEHLSSIYYWWLLGYDYQKCSNGSFEGKINKFYCYTFIKKKKFNLYLIIE